jgi:hypothetical protein
MYLVLVAILRYTDIRYSSCQGTEAPCKWSVHETAVSATVRTSFRRNISSSAVPSSPISFNNNISLVDFTTSSTYNSLNLLVATWLRIRSLPPLKSPYCTTRILPVNVKIDLYKYELELVCPTTHSRIRSEIHSGIKPGWRLLSTRKVCR